MEISKLVSLPFRKFEYKISLIYLLIGLLWIHFSDVLLALLIKDPILLTQFQTYKGSFYIFVTAFLLFLMVQKHMRKLNEQQTLFKTMFNTISDSVIIASPERRIVMVNDSTLQKFGYQRSELIGKSTEVLYGDSSDFWAQGQKVFDELSENDSTSAIITYRKHSEERFPAETFSSKLFDNKGTWLGNLAIIHDITERERAETELHETRVKLAAAMNSMTDAVSIVDRDGNFIDFNEAFASFYKFQDKASCSRTLREFPDFLEVYRPDGTLLSLDQWSTARALKGETATNQEYALHRKDTGETWVGSYSFAPVRDKAGNITGAVVTVRDITQKKIAEGELIKAKERAEESDRLKTLFLQNISHEIRTPMNAIIGFTELLRDSTLAPDQQKNYKDIIVNSSNQLLTIVNDILTVSLLETKQASISSTPVKVNALLNELESVFAKTASEKGLNLIIDLENDSDFCMHTDETKVRQVLTNLLSNAFKFTRKGNVTLGYHRNDRFIEFYVKDTGMGIESAMHEKIFERFRRTEVSITGNYSGTGLGLTISKEFIELLGGNIWVESEVGVGSAFRISIPFHHCEPETVIAKSAIPLLNRSVILVAEDAKLNYLLIETLLNKREAYILHAWNGQEAIDLCAAHPEISLVIMDLNMPIMDGYQATTVIKKQHPELPIVAFSAYTLPQEIEKAKAYGFDAYLTKPVNTHDLDTVLEQFFKKDQ